MNRHRPCVFISASVPDPERWNGQVEPLAITDAVTAVARAVLSSELSILTAAHPTIAPLILYVAGDLPDLDGETDRVVLYQSALFEAMIPKATQQLMRQPILRVVWTPAAPGGDPTDRSTWAPSLAEMRASMFSDEDIAAAVFIGGMDGIREEYDLVETMVPDVARYPVGAAGGEAASLPYDGRLRSLLATSRAYAHLAEHIVQEVTDRLA